MPQDLYQLYFPATTDGVFLSVLVIVALAIVLYVPFKDVDDWRYNLLQFSPASARTLPDGHPPLHSTHVGEIGSPVPPSAHL